MNKLNVGELATAVTLWLSYISAVGRNYVLSEGAIRFPVSEYLEKLKKDDDTFELEFLHPKLLQKRFDLCFKKYIKLENNVKIFETDAFEFKYIKNGSTRNIKVKQNIFNDLMRLFLFSDENNKSYFLICGNQEDFQMDFQTIFTQPKNTDGNAFPAPQFDNNPIENTLAEGFYTEWFSFNNENPSKIIDLTINNPDYSEIYQTFIKQYAKAYSEKNNKEKLALPNQIITNLVFISGDITQSNGYFLPSKIAIWEITKNNII